MFIWLARRRAASALMAGFHGIADFVVFAICIGTAVFVGCHRIDTCTVAFDVSLSFALGLLALAIAIGAGRIDGIGRSGNAFSLLAGLVLLAALVAFAGFIRSTVLFGFHWINARTVAFDISLSFALGLLALAIAIGTGRIDGIGGCCHAFPLLAGLCVLADFESFTKGIGTAVLIGCQRVNAHTIAVDISWCLAVG